MKGILKSKALPNSSTTTKKHADFSENDIYFSFQIAKANARRNATMLSNVIKADPQLSFKQEVKKIEADHSRNVRFFDETPLSPKSVSRLKASRNKFNSLSLSGAAPALTKSATVASNVQPVIRESLLNPLDQYTLPISDKRARISTQFDQRLPNFVESIMSGWKDALVSNDLFQSLAPAWLNGSKPL
jgi:hypothetical protein